MRDMVLQMIAGRPSEGSPGVYVFPYLATMGAERVRVGDCEVVTALNVASTRRFSLGILVRPTGAKPDG